MADAVLKGLKSRAHILKPVVWLGQHGLTEAVLSEIELALNAHQLIKIKVPGEDREERKQILLSIQEKTQSTLVQLIGKIATFYRKNDVPTNKVKKAAPKRSNKRSAQRKSRSSR